MCDKCLLKYGFSWTPRAGRAGLWGESLPNDTLRQKCECQAGQHWPDSLCPGATTPAQGRVHPAVPAAPSSTSGDSWVSQTLFISETQSFWSFLPNVAIWGVTGGNSTPPGNSLQSPFTASAPSGEVYCNVQVLISIFVPLKQWKWLNKP